MRAETGEPRGFLTLTFGAAPRRSQQWPEMNISQDEGLLIIACDTLDSLVCSSCQKAFANYLEDLAIRPPTRLRTARPLWLFSADESGSRCGALELPLVVGQVQESASHRSRPISSYFEHRPPSNLRPPQAPRQDRARSLSNKKPWPFLLLGLSYPRRKVRTMSHMQDASQFIFQEER